MFKLHSEELRFSGMYATMMRTISTQEVTPVSDSRKYLYVLFSSTPYKMGRMIRMVTGEPYNHVAIATEEDLHNLYAFARRYYNTPFYGGFVTEHPSRYHHKGVTADIRLYRLPLTDRQWENLQTLLTDMRRRADRYLYNHLSALAAPLHLNILVRDAFTCAEFAVSVLSTLGFDFDPNRFYTIGDIAERLESYHIYTGVFPAKADEDSIFFQPYPLRHPILASTRNFLALLGSKSIP